MHRPWTGSIVRIAKIYDLMRDFDWVNKAGICELGIVARSKTVDLPADPAGYKNLAG
jgi:hypothetical protein